MRDMKIRNSNRITELALHKLTRTQKMRKEEQERHEIKANILAINCEALILDWRGHQRPLPFHPLDR